MKGQTSESDMDKYIILELQEDYEGEAYGRHSASSALSEINYRREKKGLDPLNYQEPPKHEGFKIYDKDIKLTSESKWNKPENIEWNYFEHKIDFLYAVRHILNLPYHLVAVFPTKCNTYYALENLDGSLLCKQNSWDPDEPRIKQIDFIPKIENLPQDLLWFQENDQPENWEALVERK